MRKKQITVPNLKDVPFTKALEIAYAGTSLTYSDIAERSGKGQETIRRYFTDPTYNPPVPLVPMLCEIIGNNTLIEWQIAQRGGHLFFVDSSCEEKDIHVRVAELTKEFCDVLTEDCKAQLDGKYNHDELSVIHRELEHLQVKAQEIQSIICSLQEERAKS